LTLKINAIRTRQYALISASLSQPRLLHRFTHLLVFEFLHTSRVVQRVLVCIVICGTLHSLSCSEHQILYEEREDLCDGQKGLSSREMSRDGMYCSSKARWRPACMWECPSAIQSHLDGSLAHGTYWNEDSRKYELFHILVRSMSFLISW